MNKNNKFWNDTFLGYAAKNILKASVLFAVIVVVSLLLLNAYTKHGKTEVVPELKGLVVEEAVNMLNRHNLKYEIIDSVFIRDKKLGTVIEQNPAPNTTVKPGRPIYLIINSMTIRKITLPDLRDISLRQAEAMAQSMGINIAGVEYISSEYKDLVIDVKYQGRSLLSGSSIPEGSSITLIAGSGTGQAPSGVTPMLFGLDLNSAINTLSATSYTLGGVIYDVPPSGNEHEYVVFTQSPAAGEPIAPGSVIDLWLSRTPQQALENFVPPHQPKRGENKEKDIEDFF